MENAVLSGTYTPATTGLYTLNIRNYRTLASTTLVHNYIDNITLKPINYMLGVDGVTFGCIFKSTRQFELNAGLAHANRNYWLLIGVSGTYPGFGVDYAQVPLNYDPLVSLCLKRPGLGGPGFFGQLDANGQATASMTGPPGLALEGLTLYFAYAVFPNSGPVVAASNHVNITYVFTE